MSSCLDLTLLGRAGRSFSTVVICSVRVGTEVWDIGQFIHLWKQLIQPHRGLKIAFHHHWWRRLDPRAHACVDKTTLWAVWVVCQTHFQMFGSETVSKWFKSDCFTNVFVFGNWSRAFSSIFPWETEFCVGLGHFKTETMIFDEHRTETET